jgi:hypothetical protein
VVAGICHAGREAGALVRFPIEIGLPWLNWLLAALHRIQKRKQSGKAVLAKTLDSYAADDRSDHQHRQRRDERRQQSPQLGVLSLPHALRFFLAANPAAFTQVIGVVYRTIPGCLLKSAGLTRATGIGNASNQHFDVRRRQDGVLQIDVFERTDVISHPTRLIFQQRSNKAWFQTGLDLCVVPDALRRG